ncbi:hypothetical protein [Flavobacterium sp. XGLA_31]
MNKTTAVKLQNDRRRFKGYCGRIRFIMRKNGNKVLHKAIQTSKQNTRYT